MRLLLAISVLLPALLNAISFELQALPEGGSANRRCFSLYIGKDLLVVGKYQTPRVQHQTLNVEGSIYYRKENADTDKEVKFAFNTHNYNDYSICFTNVLDRGVAPHPSFVRSLTFDLKIGPQNDDGGRTKEDLKPIEVELRVLEQVMEGIVDEMEYLKEREAMMRDTNESTNDRVKWLSMLSVVTLIGSGAWQVLYLKQFFKTKKLL